MSDTTKINKNEIMDYILIHNINITKDKLEKLTLGELVLMKVRMQIEMEKK
jgi:hypothetical protein